MPLTNAGMWCIMCKVILDYTTWNGASLWLRNWDSSCCWTATATFSEIGQPLGITRQGVRALIKRSEAILLNYEDKLKFAERLAKMRECLDSISDAAQYVTSEDIRRKIEEQASIGKALL